MFKLTLWVPTSLLEVTRPPLLLPAPHVLLPISCPIPLVGEVAGALSPEVAARAPPTGGDLLLLLPLWPLVVGQDVAERAHLALGTPALKEVTTRSLNFCESYWWQPVHSPHVVILILLCCEHFITLIAWYRFGVSSHMTFQI